MNYDEFYSMLDGPIQLGTAALQQFQDQSETSIEPRRFKLQEVIDLLGLPHHQRLYRAMESDSIPHPRTLNNRAKFYTIEDIEKIRDYFDVYPGKMPGERAARIAFTTFKGGATKTTTVFQFAGYLSVMGYRVLLVDVDPQATLTMLMDMEPNISTLEEHTASEILVSDDDPDPDELRKVAIHSTRLPNVDIMPSCMRMQTVEMLLSRKLVEASGRRDRSAVVEVFFRLSRILDCVNDDYDVIVMDGTPSLGLLPLNMICASDSVVVPVPSSINDFASTTAFLQMLVDYINSVASLDVGVLPLPVMRFLTARFRTDKAASRSTDIWSNLAKRTYGELLLNNAIHKHDSVIDNCLTFHRSAFEINHTDLGIPLKAIRAAREDYAKLFDEILDECIHPVWPSKTSHEGGVIHG